MIPSELSSCPAGCSSELKEESVRVRKRNRCGERKVKVRSTHPIGNINKVYVGTWGSVCKQREKISISKEREGSINCITKIVFFW